MSNANDVVNYMKEETTFGTLATGNWDTIRVRGDLLKLETATENSDELGTRRVTDVVRTDRKVSGTIPMRFSYKNSDPIFRGALCAPEVAGWATVVTQVLTITAASADNSLVRSAGDWAADGYLAGRWIRVKGLTTNGTEFYCRITSHSSATKIIVDNITLVNEGPTASVEVEQGGYITDGSTEHFYSWERKYGDLASNFRTFTSLEFGQLNFSVNAKGLAEITATCTGKTSTFSATTSAGTPVAKQTGRLINGIDHVSACLEGGTAVAMSEWSFTVNNNLRERNVFGTLGPESIGRGQFNATVNLNGYYANNTILAKYDAFTDTSLAFKVRDASGNAYVFHWPNGNFSDGSGMPTANNSDVFQPVTFQSKEYTLGALVMQMQIARWDV